MFLQADRDRLEAGQALPYEWDAGLPDIDALFCEWRWRVPGRNTTTCGAPGHTCDLHRQQEMLHHYTVKGGVATILWDKDQRLSSRQRLRYLPNVTVCEPAFFPHQGAVSLLFPIEDRVLDAADPNALANFARDIPLVYIGNQYGREQAFDTYFAPAATKVPHLVAGKWPQADRWPDIEFVGRIPFTEVVPLYQRSLATIQLAPDRYAVCGQFTQRLFEAVLAGCLPLGLANHFGVESVIPAELIISTGTETCDAIERLRSITGTPAHASLIRECLQRLAPFRLSRQLRTLNILLTGGNP